MIDSPDDTSPPAPSQAPAPHVADTAAPGEPDLDAVERDLDGVDAALGRLDDGSYWTDEVTGEEIPDSVLADDPTARRA